ncbi:MAG: hypothetical protein H7Z42_01810 [Roseiflexaceae bacterium]|nr:hypothetical protein [Roseiflexaceae bacterium]
MALFATERLALLRAQLRGGWNLEMPVFEHAVYSGPTGQASAFEFVLRSQGNTQILAVPDSPELQQFLEEYSLAVIV